MVPEGATLTVIDVDGKPVPLQVQNAFGEYVNVMATD